MCNHGCRSGLILVLTVLSSLCSLRGRAHLHLCRRSVELLMTNYDAVVFAIQVQHNEESKMVQCYSECRHTIFKKRDDYINHRGEFVSLLKQHKIVLSAEGFLLHQQSLDRPILSKNKAGYKYFHINYICSCWSLIQLLTKANSDQLLSSDKTWLAWAIQVKTQINDPRYIVQNKLQKEVLRHLKGSQVSSGINFQGLEFTIRYMKCVIR